MKPEYWQDEKLGPQSDFVRLLFIGLISQADDMGRMIDNAPLISILLFPVGDRAADVIDGLTLLAELGRLKRGTTKSGQRVIQIVRWNVHQRVDHPNKKSAFPAIIRERLANGNDTEAEHVGVPAVADNSREIRERFANDSRTIPVPVPTTSTSDQRPATRTLQGSGVVGEISVPGKRQAPPSAAADAPPADGPTLCERVQARADELLGDGMPADEVDRIIHAELYPS